MLNQFNKEDIEVVHTTSNEKSNKEYLHQELADIESGKANFMSQDEFENSLD